MVEMLRNMNVGLESLNQTGAWITVHDVQDWEQAAIYYLKAYEDRWRAWVIPKAYEKINKALEEASG